jgi:hypothetical protein
MAGLVAPAAQAAPTPLGSCEGSTGLATVSDGATGGLSDANKHITVKTKVLKELVGPKSALGGSCDGLAFEPLSPTGDGQPPSQMTPKAIAASLAGSASCAQSPADLTNSPLLAWPVSGKISITMTQTHATGTDVGKPWAVQGYISLLGSNLDVFDIGGLVTKGADVGAQITGSLWEDPSVKMLKTDPGYPGYHDTGYQVDPNAITNLLACADGNNTTHPNPEITQALVGGGSSTLADPNQNSANSPLLGSSAAGLQFQAGE